MAATDLTALRVNGVPVFGGVNPSLVTGDVRFVDDSGTDLPGSGAEDNPLASLDYAIGRCTINQGDHIILKEGHAETLTTQITADMAGITIVGLGHGDNRPTLTINAAIFGIYCNVNNVKFINIRIVAGASATVLTELLRVKGDNVKFIGCQFEMAYDMYHMVTVTGGNDVQFLDCVFLNAVTTSADTHPQTALLDKEGTKTLVKGCRFNDLSAKKAERWRVCVEGGKMAASGAVNAYGQLTVEDCTFECRGVATGTRTAGASGYMATLFCRAVSPSSNTAAGFLFTPTYQNIVESYDVAAVNKVGLVSVTTA